MSELDQEEIRTFVRNEGLVSFSEDAGPKHCSAVKISDDAENQLWSVNVVVGVDEKTYITSSIPIFPYSKVGEPNTMFNQVPIKAATR